MIRSAITVSLVREAEGGPFVFWHDLPGAITSASRHGFDGIEIFAPGPAAFPSDLDAMLRRANLQLAAVGTGAGWLIHKWQLCDADPAQRQQARQFIRSMIEVGGRYGAPTIIGSMQGRWGGEVDRPLALTYLAEALRELGDYAASFGTFLLYEPLNRYETNLFHRQADAAEFLRQERIENVRLLCDLFHMNIEEADIATTLRNVAGVLGHVHFVDSNRRAAGLGHLDYAPIAAALRESSYTGYLSAEALSLPDAETAAAATMAAFRHWFPR